MDQEKRERYYQLFEEMVDAMTMIPGFDRDWIVRIVTDICELFHLSKAETQFYRSLSDEKRGEGETICDYDNGKSSRIGVQRRLLSRSGAVVMSAVYLAEGDTLTEEESEKIDIMLRAMMSFIGRNRLQVAVERLGFYDENDYPNMRAFIRFLEQLSSTNRLVGHTAVCFNLRRFSLVNQQLGRDLGDVVMRKYYLLLKNIY